MHPRTRRGQFFPMFFALFSLILVIAVWTWNYMGFETAARAIAADAARAAGQAALRQTDPDEAAEGRWYVDPEAGLATAYEYIDAALFGLPGTISQHRFFSDELHLALVDEGGYGAPGTDEGTEPGIDVEIIDPPYGSAGDVERYLNGSVAPVDACSEDGREGAISVLTEDCYTRASVIIRILYEARQVGSATITRQVVAPVSAGTNLPTE